ncbi:transcription factor divaricata [Phtheirospermum japonicum]|uniref:Transcription factor divaricata n=1 Tax=Phtheirospermum japonicum TaxID=374723 RepID=A0A830BUM7_9LAMI|nr:transcription factor divaricata [Phtheirospermum japonicum]
MGWIGEAIKSIQLRKALHRGAIDQRMIQQGQVGTTALALCLSSEATCADDLNWLNQLPNESVGHASSLGSTEAISHRFWILYSTLFAPICEMAGAGKCFLVTGELREGAQRVGFEVVTLDGRRAPLASTNISSWCAFLFEPSQHYQSDAYKNTERIIVYEFMPLRTLYDLLHGIPWTEEEHMQFLLSLQKFGKGDLAWYIQKLCHSRTPTQVASHAQKYFIRQSNAIGKKK